MLEGLKVVVVDANGNEAELQIKKEDGPGMKRRFVFQDEPEGEAMVVIRETGTGRTFAAQVICNDVGAPAKRDAVVDYEAEYRFGDGKRFAVITGTSDGYCDIYLYSLSGRCLIRDEVITRVDWVGFDKHTSKKHRLSGPQDKFAKAIRKLRDRLQFKGDGICPHTFSVT